MNRTKLDGGQRGVALVIAVFAMVVVALLAAAFVSTGMISTNVATISRQQAEAYYIAEAGTTHAIQQISSVAASTTNYTAILGANGTNAGTWDELHPTIPSGGKGLGTGTYKVKVEDDHEVEQVLDINTTGDDDDANRDANRTLIVTSIGTARDGSTVTIEATITSTVTPALLVNGPLHINGNPRITGGMHVNGDLSIGGAPCLMSGTVSATGTITDGYKFRQGPSCNATPQAPQAASQPAVVMPNYNIQNDFRHLADFILGSDGKVRNQAGQEQAMSGVEWSPAANVKWKWLGSGTHTWEHTGSDVLDNTTLYAVGNLKMGNSFGSSGSPRRATFIAEGSILVSGNPYVGADLTIGIAKYGFIAGKDLELSGNPGTTISSGINYAGDQLKVNGTAQLNGLLIAGNKSDTFPPGNFGNIVPLSSGSMQFSGDATINYTGNLVDEKPILVSWREVRKLS